MRHVLKKVIRSVLASYDASHALVVSLLCPNFRHFLKDLSTLRSSSAVMSMTADFSAIKAAALYLLRQWFLRLEPSRSQTLKVNAQFNPLIPKGAKNLN